MSQLKDYSEIVKDALSLNEMYDILESEHYKSLREERNIKVQTREDGSRWVLYFHVWHHPSRPLLYHHIAAEQLLTLDLEGTDWDDYGLYDSVIRLSMLRILMNPLVWSAPLPDDVVDGRIARECYCPDRLNEIGPFLNYIWEQRILNFADNPVVYDEDYIDIGILKGMHAWENLTDDYSSIEGEIINGSQVSPKDIMESCKPYNASSLHSSLSLIAERRGGKRAAELLRMLQKEWPDIKRWYNQWEAMTKEDIERFEDQLMNGFNNLLKEWETENGNITKEEANRNSENKELSIITDACKKAGEEENVKSALRVAIKTKKAVEVWKAISNNERDKQPYLCTKGMDMSKIYRALKEWYGELPFTDRTFRNGQNKGRRSNVG